MHALLSSSRESLFQAGDELLVDLAREGDETAVRILVQRHNRRLYRVARAVLGSDAEAEDVVQEAHMRAFGALDRFRGDSSFATWLTRIALNEAFGRLRRRRSTVGLEKIEQEMLDGGRVVMFPSTLATPNPEQTMGRLEARQLLEQAVEELPEPFRIVLVMRDVEEMSIEETAGYLGLKPATVKTRLHRARKLMRESLARRMAATLPDLYPFAGERCERVADKVVEMMRYRRNRDSS